MFKHILLPTDGSELSESAIKTGIHLAKALGAKVTGVMVIPTDRSADEEKWEGASSAPASLNRHLLFIRIVANGNGVDCALMSIRGDSPSDEIMKVAEKLHCDLIVMASHGRGSLETLFIGSETQKVLVHSHLPVLVCR